MIYPSNSGRFVLPSNQQMVGSLPIGKINDLDTRVSKLENNPSGGSPIGGLNAIQVYDTSTTFNGDNTKGSFDPVTGQITLTSDTAYGAISLASPVNGEIGGIGIEGTNTIIIGATAGDMSLWTTQAMNFSIDGGNNIQMKLNSSGNLLLNGGTGLGVNLEVNGTIDAVYYHAYSYGTVIDNNGNANFATLGVGMTSPAYVVDVYDQTGTGTDIGNSTTGHWNIASSTSPLNLTRLTIVDDYAQIYLNNVTSGNAGLILGVNNTLQYAFVGASDGAQGLGGNYFTIVDLVTLQTPMTVGSDGTSYLSHPYGSATSAQLILSPAVLGNSVTVSSPFYASAGIALTYGSGTGLTFQDGTTQYTAGGIALQTNYTPNGSQSLLNLIAGSNVSLYDDGFGDVTISASGGSGSPGGNQYDVQINDGSGGFTADDNNQYVPSGSYGVSTLLGTQYIDATNSSITYNGVQLALQTTGWINMLPTTGNGGGAFMKTGDASPEYINTCFWEFHAEDDTVIGTFVAAGSAYASGGAALPANSLNFMSAREGGINFVARASWQASFAEGPISFTSWSTGFKGQFPVSGGLLIANRSGTLPTDDGVSVLQINGDFVGLGLAKFPSMPTADPADGTYTLWYDSITRIVSVGT